MKNLSDIFNYKIEFCGAYFSVEEYQKIKLFQAVESMFKKTKDFSLFIELKQMSDDIIRIIDSYHFLAENIITNTVKEFSDISLNEIDDVFPVMQFDIFDVKTETHENEYTIANNLIPIMKMYLSANYYSLS